MSVKIVKFLSGQEIICKVDANIATLPGHVAVSSPLTIQPMKQQDGRFSIGLMPFSWAGQGDVIHLRDAHILCQMEAEPDLEKQYLASLSGIVIPKERITL